MRPVNIEGQDRNDWILIDYFDFIIHIFSEDKRSFYDIDRLWADAKITHIEDQDENKFQEVLLSTLSELGYPTEKVIVQSPKNPDHGDFTTNYPMINSKEIGKPPMDIASTIVDK